MRGYLTLLISGALTLIGSGAVILVQGGWRAAAAGGAIFAGMAFLVGFIRLLVAAERSESRESQGVRARTVPRPAPARAPAPPPVPEPGREPAAVRVATRRPTTGSPAPGPLSSNPS